MKTAITIFIVTFAFVMQVEADPAPSLERVLRQSNQLSTTSEDIFPTTPEPTKSYIQCRADYTKLICKYGYHQLVTNIYLNCGENEEALTLAGLCDVSDVGSYCLEPYLADLDLGEGITLHYQSQANRQCLSVTENVDETCTEDCKSALNDMKTHYGCCINSVLNSTGDTSRIYGYELWSRCGVDTPTNCGGDTMSVSLVHDAPVCTEDELLYKELRDLRCTSGNHFLLDKMATEIEDCEEFIRLNKQWCLTNTEGVFCTEVSEMNAAMVREVYKNCSSTQNECPPDCKSALKGLKDKLGCCIDSTYDSEYFLTYGKRFNLTDDELWEQCDIAPPPRACANMLDGALRSQADFIGTLVAVVLLLAVEKILTS